MTAGSLFSGIGGFDLGVERAGFDIKWQVEIDNYDREVLRQTWPKASQYADIRDMGWNLRHVDLIFGGFPCQDISDAGARVGIDGLRSGLWSEFARLVGLLRPRYVIVENVAALLDRGMGRVLGDLSAFGFDAEWDVVSACEFGAPHPRERVFIVAYPKGQRPRQLRWERRAAECEAARNLYWPTDEPGCERVVDGIPYRAQRLIALGNAVVPVVAEWIARQILEAEK